MNRTAARISVITATVAVSLFGAVGTASAHPHQVEPAHQGTGQVLGNGALHGAFVNGVTCGGDPAAYGLETAHHGTDSGTPGNADGCYQIDGTVPGEDVTSPVIR
jgi:hypothetical protein